jgi:hypothetical protein
MIKSNRFIWMGLLVLLMASAPAFAQRPRTIQTNDTPNATDPNAPVPPLAPQTVKTKYEGGWFGYNKKIDGTITFDDANKRLLFRNKYQQEVFSIPYDSVAAAFADTKSKRPIAADVASRVSIYALPAMLIKKKFRYLTLQYKDPDTSINGIASFKMENKEILSSVLYTLAQKAGLTQRGEVYVRRKETATSDQTSPE